VFDFAKEAFDQVSIFVDIGIEVAPFCGCGSGWTNGLVPDSVYGVNISYACFVHDRNYSADSTMSRVDADWQLALDIARILEAAGISSGFAADAAMLYHVGVRTGGYFAYEGQGRGD
jgi:hypothetical protein